VPALLVAALATLLIALGVAGLMLSSRPSMIGITRSVPAESGTTGTPRPVVVEAAASVAIPGVRVTGFSYAVDRDPGTVPPESVSATCIAPGPQQTPTYDGSGQANHPSLVDFLTEYGMRSWGGYRYWMMVTPYQNDDDRYENPSLLASHDGVGWVAPAGVPAPLAGPLPGYRPLENHLSDAELVYDPSSDSLVAFYRENAGREATSAEYIHRQDISYRGGSFTTTLHPRVISRYNRDVEIMSPAVVIDDAGMWHMWFTSMYPNGGSVEHTGTLRLFHCSSADGLSWGDPSACAPTMTDFYARLAPEPHRLYGGGGALYPWHVEARRNGSRVDLLITSTALPARASLDQGSGLILAATDLSDPTALRYPLDAPIVWGSQDEAVYRAGLVTGATFRIWYSARTAGAEHGTWRVEFTEGRVAEDRTWATASSVAIPLTGLEPGEWYVHARAVNSLGVWSEPTHTRVMIGGRR